MIQRDRIVHANSTNLFRTQTPEGVKPTGVFVCPEVNVPRNRKALLTAAQAVHYFAVELNQPTITQRMISDWRRAGHLPVAEYRRVGKIQRPYYRLGDLETAEMITRTNPSSARYTRPRQLVAA